jgi:hypothetical protein
MTALVVVIAVNVVVSLFGFRAHSEKFLFIPHQVARGGPASGRMRSFMLSTRTIPPTAASGPAAACSAS